MLGQGKNVYQAEIDAACELIDFLRFNVHFLGEIYKQQPISSPGMNNRVEWRPLEGFVLAVSPFNFTAIGGNLCASAALCGNVVVWKPAYTQIYSANIFMKVLIEAGLPDGVINLVYVDGAALGKVCFSHRDFAGIHFTGSTGVFNTMWKSIGENINKYKSYPRIVGETGGKDFVVIHKSADVDVAVTALIRGAFEFQGQKCSAASRAYLPSNIADAIKEKLIPPQLAKDQINFVYANEADMLNVALFGMTAKQWRDENFKAEGNIRDGATIEQLVVLSNMESINAVLIHQGLKQSERLQQLNQIAITQMKSLLGNKNLKKLK